MIETTLFGFILGLMLGIRFRVFVVVPATVSVMLWALAWSVISDLSMSSIIITQILAAAAVQFGYVGSAIAVSRASTRQHTFAVPPVR